MEKPCLFIGTGAVLYRDLITTHLGFAARFAPALQNHVQASTVALLAWQKFERHGLDSDHPVVPDYLRQSDAELNLQR
jgi:tRNA threonylcarbamoyladenosine biosynthesis protein TsaB